MRDPTIGSIQLETTATNAIASAAFAPDPAALQAIPKGAMQIDLPCAKSLPVWLLPERAIFIPQVGALIVADVHIGKAATFRSLGVPVPHGTTNGNLARISNLIDQLRPRTIYFLGDLLHGPVAMRPRIIESLAVWRAQYSEIDMVLIGGNHDAKAGQLPTYLNIALASEPHLSDALKSTQLYLCHEPQTIDQGYVLAGHWHPVYRLIGRADSARLPCFWQQQNQMILPAFGEFTGGHPASLEANNKLYLSDGRQVHCLKVGKSR